MEIVLAVCTLEGYVSSPVTAGAPVGYILMVADKVVDSTMFIVGSNTALTGRVSEDAALASES